MLIAANHSTVLVISEAVNRIAVGKFSGCVSGYSSRSTVRRNSAVCRRWLKQVDDKLKVRCVYDAYAPADSHMKLFGALVQNR